MDSAVAAELDGLDEQFLGAHEERPVGAGGAEREDGLVVFEVAAAVLDTDDFWLLGELLESIEFEPHFGHGGHVVEHEGEREFGEEVADVVEQFCLAGGKVVGHGEDEG